MSKLETAAQTKVAAAGIEIMGALKGAAAAPADQKLASLRANLNRVANIPTKDIELGENIRKEIDQKSPEFQQLVQSVKKFGILASPVVELRDEEDGYRLVCVAGHRRILAALNAGTIERIPCLVKSYGDSGDRVGAALSENLNRQDLHCLDIAEAYGDLIAAAWTDESIAKQFDRNIKTVRHYLKISGWPQEAKNLIRENKPVFTTRVVMQRLAYQKFADNAALLRAIKALIQPNKSEPAKDIRRGEIVRKRVSAFFATRPDLSKENKQLVLDALQHFRIVPADFALSALSSPPKTKARAAKPIKRKKR